MSDINFNKPPNKNESGVLAYLWRKILLENNLMPSLGMLISRYIKEQDITAGRVSNLKKKNKTTLVNNIGAQEMTFKTFLDLIFNFLKVRRLDISIKLTYHNDKTSEHSVSIDGSNFPHNRPVKLEEEDKEVIEDGNSKDNT